MKLFMKILGGILILLIVLSAISFLLPSKLEMNRSIVIKADPSTVYEVVADFDRFNNYSPWHAMEPEAKTEISGTKGEADYRYSWDGEKLGKGSMTRTQSIPNNEIVNDLYFADFDAHSTDKWTFENTPEGVKATWWNISEDTNNPMMRYMNAMMKGSLEEQFDQGLVKLKDYCEKLPPSENMGQQPEQEEGEEETAPEKAS